MEQVECPKCKVDMVRRKSKFTEDAYWWGCPNFPDCKVTCSEHPDGSMMSTPAGEKLKGLRQKAHKLMEEIFGKWEEKDAKKEMYDWLESNTEKGHIGLMNESEVKSVIRKLEK